LQKLARADPKLVASLRQGVRGSWVTWGVDYLVKTFKRHKAKKKRAMFAQFRWFTLNKQPSGGCKGVEAFFLIDFETKMWRQFNGHQGQTNQENIIN